MAPPKTLPMMLASVGIISLTVDISDSEGGLERRRVNARWEGPQKLIKMIPPGGLPLLVKQIPVGPMQNFVYLVVDESSKEAMVVDSGWETGPILSAAKEAEAKVRYAVATHGHFDHVTTLGEAAKALGAKVVAHENSSVDCDLKVKDGDFLRLGRSEVKVLYTPGHTEDSICLYDGKEVFTGDTLFVGTIGRLEKAGLRAMYDSLYHV